MKIDMRVRPPYGTFLKDLALYTEEGLQGCATMFKTEVPQAAQERSIELFIREMDEAGVDKVVAPVRATSNGKNEVIAELLKLYPGRFVGMAGINPLDDICYNLSVIDQYVVNGDFTGINIEPGFTPEPFAKDGLHCNDRIIYPIYEKCEKEGKTVMLSFGGLCHEGLYNFHPEDLDQILADFPKMRVVISHGGYPYLPQVFWIAQRRQNLWIGADVYAFAGGGSQYVEAARHFCQNRICYGSGYPIVSLQKAIDLYDSFNMDEDTYAQVMGKAAELALGL